MSKRTRIGLALAAGMTILVASIGPAVPRLRASPQSALVGTFAAGGLGQADLGEFTGKATGIQDTAAIVTTCQLNGTAGDIIVEVSNKAGGSALTAFTVDLLPCTGASYHTYLSGADFLVATANLPFVSTASPVTLAAGSSTMFVVDARGAKAIKFTATGAAAPAAASEVTVRASRRTWPAR